MVANTKTLNQFLEEDPRLTGQFTYEEYQNGAVAPDSIDITVEDAYKSYCEKRTRLKNVLG